MSDHTFLKRVLFLLVPVLALSFGWQLGRGYQMSLGATSVVSALPANAATASGMFLQPEKEADLSQFWTVWHLLNQRYVDPNALQGKKMIYGATEGMVRAAGDPYTVFMEPQEVKDFAQSMNGELDGIGAELTETGDLVTIVSTLKDSPAEHAGLQSQDAIFSIDGQVTSGMSLDQIVSKIRGKQGTTVTLKIYRKGEISPRSFTITRQHITVPSTESKILPSKNGPIGVLTLHEFGDHTVQEAGAILQDFQKQHVTSIILDLRFNGGGYLDGAVDIVSMFVKSGTVVSVERRGQPLEVIPVRGNPIFPDLPMAVLINESSASASEITAGALQDHGRAKIIGVKSFGKGTVQDVLDLPDGSALKVTIAHWLTPRGKNLGKEGVTPDINVVRTTDEYNAKKDPQMDAAVAWLTEKK